VIRVRKNYFIFIVQAYLPYLPASADVGDTGITGNYLGYQVFPNALISWYSDIRIS